MLQTSGETAGSRVLSDFGSLLSAFVSRFADDIVISDECAADPASLTALLASGPFLLQRAPSDLPVERCRLAAADLFELLRMSIPDLGPEIDRVAQVFTAGHIDERRFLQLTLANEANALMQLGRRFELREDLLVLFAVLLARPFRTRAARLLAGKVDLQVWGRGCCPVCGHWPSLAHIDDHQGFRMLWCLHCNTLWPYPRLGCVFCFHTDQELLEILHPEGEPNLRVQACRSCGRYIKEVRSLEAVAAFPFDAVYMGTGALDLMAINNGYFQESALAVRSAGQNGVQMDPGPASAKIELNNNTWRLL